MLGCPVKNNVIKSSLLAVLEMLVFLLYASLLLESSLDGCTLLEICTGKPQENELVGTLLDRLTKIGLVSQRSMAYRKRKKDRTEHGFGYTDKGQSLDSSMERKMMATKEEAAGMKSLVRRRSILRISDRNLLGEEEQNIKGRHNAGSRFRCDSKPPTLVVSKTS
jgi:hypothetical protein